MNMTNSLSKAQVLSETRAIARNLGMTFRVNDSASLNNQPLYDLVNRKTGDVISKNFTLAMGYENALSGYFAEVAEKNNCAVKNA